MAMAISNTRKIEMPTTMATVFESFFFVISGFSVEESCAVDEGSGIDKHISVVI